jgi:hypothetical protein
MAGGEREIEGRLEPAVILRGPVAPSPFEAGPHELRVAGDLSTGPAPQGDGARDYAQPIRTRRFCLPFFSIWVTRTAPISEVRRTWVPPHGCRS